ncbi:MAG: bicyclomycin resistance protein [Gammaproteobacteria bacterium]|nr:bicyclomycin resistance protein [Gammaproteobacteria bacterium]
MRLINLKVASLVISTMFIGGSVTADTIRFWTIEDKPPRLAKQQAMADDFKALTGHDVEVIPIDEKDLGKRATAAFAAGDLPDVIYHTLQYVLPWAEAGILDVETNADIVDSLKKSTFAPGAISMAQFDGMTAGVPVDGWTQMVVYRKDLFEAAGLEAPTSFAAIETAIDKLHNPPSMYGFVAPNKVDENFMSQVLEHVFLANGLSPVGSDGFASLDKKKTVEVLDFYKKIATASPPGELFWKQSREVYFAGKAAMIIWSPFILDELAGLRDSAPPTINDDPTSTELASKTGIVTTFGGPSNPSGAAWADIRYLGVTNDANTDVATQFVEYSMKDGYTSTLSIAPEGKFPVRRGEVTDTAKYIKAWSKLPVGVDRKAPLSDVYDSRTIRRIVEGLETANRWGVKEGQLTLASKMINSQVINRVVRGYIDDEISADDAVARLNSELKAIE